MISIKNQRKIVFEGNIGVGKSTMSALAEQYIPNSIVIPEPVPLWKETVDSNNENILCKFYQDQKRYSFAFQMFACITRMMKKVEAINTSNADVLLFDRSVNTDKKVFAQMLYDDGKINELEFKIYCMQYDFYTTQVCPETYDKIIYLRCEPEIAYSRIKKRNRSEEKDISLSYLTKVHNYHEKWLCNNSNVMVVDCNKDFENNVSYQQEIMTKIKDLI